MCFRFLFLALLFFGITVQGQAPLKTEKPWTYWWWMGNAVDRPNIQLQLSEFAEAGLGGVHIIPIYGVRGFEDKFLPFLSEEWMAMVRYTMQEARKLDLGVDLTLGTGWPYGGPWITPRYAAKKLVTSDFSSLEVEPTRQMVKRAAPGGEGWVLDYFDAESVRHYLHHFDSVFSHTAYPVHPRAFYHDSYEVYGADWTTGLPAAFQQQHGYDLLEHLSVLGDPAHPDHPLVKHDVRATLAELLYTEFTRTWTDWSTERGRLTRNQAHGSPGNLLDLYGLSSIPETESFGCSDFDIPGLSCDPDYDETRFGRPYPLVMKFASSPAHLMGKALVSSETGTWLANHFRVSLRRLKPQIDELFTAGINHVFYHGIAYSPKEEGFPGWLFYASTNFGPTSHFWDELPQLNGYIETCQTLLQQSEPDNDILLYFPLSDLWTKDTGNLLLMLEVHHYKQWFSVTSFGRIAEQLWNLGYSFDYISDKQIKGLTVDHQALASLSGPSSYRVLVVPAVDYIPESTLREFERLAGQGLKILFTDHYPGHYAGYRAAEQGRAPSFDPQDFILSSSLPKELEGLGIPREELKELGLDFIRKDNEQGKLYFVTNLGNRFLEDSIRLNTGYRYVSILDPQTNQEGYVKTTGRFNLQVPPGKSYFLQTLDSLPRGTLWNVTHPVDTLRIDRQWVVRFEDWKSTGLHKAYLVDSLSSWTEWDDPGLTTFCGKARYSSSFAWKGSGKECSRVILHIDEVRETARVIVNGIPQGTLWTFPNQLELSPDILKEENRIDVVVQNLSANYMRSYDELHPEWKKFYDINFVDITYTPFNASEWPLEPSGIMGKVYITLEK